MIFQPAQKSGGLAQLGERLHGMQEVSGSIPLSSTKIRSLSSRGLGHDPFTVGTGVRIPVGTPSLLFAGQRRRTDRKADCRARQFQKKYAKSERERNKLCYHSLPQHLGD